MGEISGGRVVRECRRPRRQRPRPVRFDLGGRQHGSIHVDLTQQPFIFGPVPARPIVARLIAEEQRLRVRQQRRPRVRLARRLAVEVEDAPAARLIRHGRVRPLARLQGLFRPARAGHVGRVEVDPSLLRNPQRERVRDPGLPRLGEDGFGRLPPAALGLQPQGDRQRPAHLVEQLGVIHAGRALVHVVPAGAGELQGMAGPVRPARDVRHAAVQVAANAERAGIGQFVWVPRVRLHRVVGDERHGVRRSVKGWSEREREKEDGKEAFKHEGGFQRSVQMGGASLIHEREDANSAYRRQISWLLADMKAIKYHSCLFTSSPVSVLAAYIPHRAPSPRQRKTSKGPRRLGKPRARP